MMFGFLYSIFHFPIDPQPGRGTHIVGQV